MKVLNRRKFLALGALGALSGPLMACQAGSPNPQGNSPLPYKQPTLTDNDWSVLNNKIQGTLVRPDSTQYATAKQLFDPRFDSVKPAAIAYCSSVADIQACLTFAQQFNLPLVPRSGGHSYAGYSTTTGIIVDITRINKITVDTKTKTATIGAGAKLIDVYATLAEHGLTVPAGSCPTVGIAGLTLGGGVGVLGRKFGLTCDNLLAANVVTADGRMRTCDANHEPELFWGLRGGGGGNFGVVSEFTFQAHAVSTLTLFTLNWPWSSAAAVVDAWQNWAPQAPDELWSNCLLLAPDDKNAAPIIRVNGVYVGAVGPLSDLLQHLTNTIEVAPTDRYVANAGILETMLYEAGCYRKSVAACHLPSQDPAGQIQRDTAGEKSDYFTALIPKQGIDALINAIAKRYADTTLGEGGIGIDAYGGAINRLEASETAFVHRKTLFAAQYSASWNSNNADAIVTANQNWLNKTWQAMRPYASGTAYQNYIDPNLGNWKQAYYGANLARLQRVKSLYDANNFFHFGQSIPLAGDA